MGDKFLWLVCTGCKRRRYRLEEHVAELHTTQSRVVAAGGGRFRALQIVCGQWLPEAVTKAS